MRSTQRLPRLFWGGRSSTSRLTIAVDIQIVVSYSAVSNAYLAKSTMIAHHTAAWTVVVRVYCHSSPFSFAAACCMSFTASDPATGASSVLASVLGNGSWPGQRWQVRGQMSATVVPLYCSPYSAPSAAVHMHELGTYRRAQVGIKSTGQRQRKASRQSVCERIGLYRKDRAGRNHTQGRASRKHNPSPRLTHLCHHRCRLRTVVGVVGAATVWATRVLLR